MPPPWLQTCRGGQLTLRALAADNRMKKLNKMRQQIPIDLSLFVEQSGRKAQCSPQLMLAAHRFLIAEVEPFREISDKVLLRLLKQDVIVDLNFAENEHRPENLCIYQRNKPADYFVLILEVSAWRCYQRNCSLPLLQLHKVQTLTLAATAFLPLSSPLFTYLLTLLAYVERYLRIFRNFRLWNRKIKGASCFSVHWKRFFLKKNFQHNSLEAHSGQAKVWFEHKQRIWCSRLAFCFPNDKYFSWLRL